MQTILFKRILTKKNILSVKKLLEKLIIKNVINYYQALKINFSGLVLVNLSNNTLRIYIYLEKKKTKTNLIKERITSHTRRGIYRGACVISFYQET